MADDIDDLLDEVETKYVDKKRSGNESKRPKPVIRNNLDEDISDILNDTHLDEKDVKRVTPVTENRTKPVTSSGQKCYPVFMGGSNHPTGLGTSISQRTCDQLRCTACDFKVCLFDNYKWASDTNYLFLRNNVPDFAKLKSKLSSAKGQRAYCCQCSWRTIKDLTSLEDPDLKWHCGKH
ncbi:cilia- and flagella-associated protein 418-like isoform X2 [Babylonia areolata]|uniref:cilia- and flagella-associated protein 418-like isoform X2 n=1 Tax=Babylonia areolata TaxID=304850 RepID=UPI003FCF408E